MRAQAAKDNSPKPGSKPESNGNTNAPATAKAAAPNKKAAAEAGDRQSDRRYRASKPTNGLPSAEAATQHADEAAKLATDAATNRENDEDNDETQATVSEGKQSKAVKADASSGQVEQEPCNAKNDTDVGNESVGRRDRRPDETASADGKPSK